MKLNDLKIAIAQRVLDSTDEERLRLVEDILDNRKPFVLGAEQKAELDADLAAHDAGKGDVFNWSQVKAYARRKRKA